MACERVCVYAFVACRYTCAIRNRGRWHDEYKWLIVDDDDGDAAADGSGDDGGGGERVRVCAGGDGPVGRGVRRVSPRNVSPAIPSLPSPSTLLSPFLSLLSD